MWSHWLHLKSVVSTTIDHSLTSIFPTIFPSLDECFVVGFLLPHFRCIVPSHLKATYFSFLPFINQPFINQALKSGVKFQADKNRHNAEFGQFFLLADVCNYNCTSSFQRTLGIWVLRCGSPVFHWLRASYLSLGVNSNRFPLSVQWDKKTGVCSSWVIEWSVRVDI